MDTYVYYINTPIKNEVPMLKFLGFISIKPIPPLQVSVKIVKFPSQNVTLHYYSGTKMDRKLIFTMNSNEGAMIFVCMGGQGVKSPLPPIIIICAIHLTN